MASNVTRSGAKQEAEPTLLVPTPTPAVPCSALSRVPNASYPQGSSFPVHKVAVLQDVDRAILFTILNASGSLGVSPSKPPSPALSLLLTEPFSCWQQSAVLDNELNTSHVKLFIFPYPTFSISSLLLVKAP